MKVGLCLCVKLSLNPERKRLFAEVTLPWDEGNNDTFHRLLDIEFELTLILGNLNVTLVKEVKWKLIKSCDSWGNGSDLSQSSSIESLKLFQSFCSIS